MRINNLGNVGIGTTANATTNVRLQIGGGGSLRVANNVTDFTLIGTDDTDSQFNTRILLSGNNRTTFLGRIEYQATTGDHIFYTTYNTTERMRIANNGNVGIGVVSGGNPVYRCHIKTTYDQVATGFH
jgi:hypothetical protein